MEQHSVYVDMTFVSCGDSLSTRPRPHHLEEELFRNSWSWVHLYTKIIHCIHALQMFKDHNSTGDCNEQLIFK
jgi:hypothetical protein